jgi:hypothetical protein
LSAFASCTVPVRLGALRFLPRKQHMHMVQHRTAVWACCTQSNVEKLESMSPQLSDNTLPHMCFLYPSQVPPHKPPSRLNCQHMYAICPLSCGHASAQQPWYAWGHHQQQQQQQQQRQPLQRWRCCRHCRVQQRLLYPCCPSCMRCKRLPCCR